MSLLVQVGSHPTPQAPAELSKRKGSKQKFCRATKHPTTQISHVQGEKVTCIGRISGYTLETSWSHARPANILFAVQRTWNGPLGGTIRLSSPASLASSPLQRREFGMVPWAMGWLFKTLIGQFRSPRCGPHATTDNHKQLCIA